MCCFISKAAVHRPAHEKAEGEKVAVGLFNGDTGGLKDISLSFSDKLNHGTSKRISSKRNACVTAHTHKQLVFAQCLLAYCKSQGNGLAQNKNKIKKKTVIISWSIKFEKKKLQKTLNLFSVFLDDKSNQMERRKLSEEAEFKR